MEETARETLAYLKDNVLVALPIAFLAGFAAMKSVVTAKQGNPALYFIVGLLGTFLGQFGIRYSGLIEVLDLVPAFRYFFDFLAAYIGSFILAWIVYLFSPY